MDRIRRDDQVLVLTGKDRGKRGQVREVAKQKMKDLNTDSLDAAANTIAGTARSMGIQVVE